jgi:FkbM family methyltransferase
VKETLINGRWSLKLPDHRADRPQWPWWEATRLAHMHHYLGDGRYTVYDIGAEEGDLPALWASWGNDVVLFEPNERVWPNIKAIWEANGLPEPMATFTGFAADSDDRAWPAFRSQPYIEIGTSVWPACADGDLIGDHGFCNLAERSDIPRVSIDAVSAWRMPPTAMTIDVEGAELHVLRGAEHTLRDRRPLVWVSVHPAFMWDMYHQVPGDLDSYMLGLDYESTYLCTDHEEHWFWSPVELDLGPR